jgi:GNAT superfamily N-acetyltransferase
MNRTVCTKIRDFIYETYIGEKFYTIRDFTIIRSQHDDIWNDLKNGDIHYHLYKTPEIEPHNYIGHFMIRVKNGQIGIAMLEPEYQGYGIGYYMVEKMTRDKIAYDGKSELFTITYEGHPFWEKLPNSTFHDPLSKQNIIDPHISRGYRFDLYKRTL